MSPFKAGPTFKSMVSWFCAASREENLLKNPVENHASVFLKFLEFLEDAPIRPRLLTRTWVSVLGFGNPARAMIVP